MQVLLTDNFGCPSARGDENVVQGMAICEVVAGAGGTTTGPAVLAARDCHTCCRRVVVACACCTRGAHGQSRVLL